MQAPNDRSKASSLSGLCNIAIFPKSAARALTLHIVMGTYKPESGHTCVTAILCGQSVPLMIPWGTSLTLFLRWA